MSTAYDFVTAEDLKRVFMKARADTVLRTPGRVDSAVLYGLNRAAAKLEAMKATMCVADMIHEDFSREDGGELHQVLQLVFDVADTASPDQWEFFRNRAVKLKEGFAERYAAFNEGGEE